jgi:H+/Cl- antiporter ClcA
MITSILCLIVYKPVRRISTHVIGPRWALLPAVIAAFLVFGLMHEVIFYYFTCAYPTWEVTWFFVLQGVCVAIEIVVKKAVTDRWQLNRAISRPLTVGFVVVTGVWLFFPQIIKNGVHEKDIKE